MIYLFDDRRCSLSVEVDPSSKPDRPSLQWQFCRLREDCSCALFRIFMLIYCSWIYVTKWRWRLLQNVTNTWRSFFLSWWRLVIYSLHYEVHYLRLRHLSCYVEAHNIFLIFFYLVNYVSDILRRIAVDLKNKIKVLPSYNRATARNSR